MKRHCLLCLLLGACTVPAPDDSALVTEPRILAVRGIPAEARPDSPVRYEALIAHPAEAPAAEAQFSYCTESRSVEERTGVSRSCLRGDGLLEVDTLLPADACSLFGPNTPPSLAGEPARRPSDPDPSGGYFIPVLAEDLSNEALPSFGFQRIRCDLAGATRELFEQYQARYRENRHPAITGMQAGGEQLIPGEVHRLAATPTTLRLEVRADSFEPYVVYRTHDSILSDERESLRVFWYASAGEFSASEGSVDRNSRAASVQWTGPEEAEPAKVWAIIRDSRGGVDWVEYPIVRSSDGR